MSITGLSGVAGEVQYDFTNLTRKQAIAAGGELYKEGKLTEQETGYLQGFSLDSAPVNPGTPEAPGYGLDSLVKRNYQSLIQQDLADNEALGQGHQNEVAADKNLLNVLSSYFSSQTATSGDSQTSATDLLG